MSNRQETSQLNQPQRSAPISSISAEVAEADQINRLIIESSRDCIKVLDLDARILFINRGGLEITEIKNFEAVREMSWLDFWKSETREKAIAAFASAKSGIPAELTAYLPTVETQTPKWWHIVLSPIRAEDHTVAKILCVSHDITQQMRATEVEKKLEEQKREREREALSESDRTLDQVFNQSPSFMTLLSVPDFRYLKSNEAHCALMRRHDLIGKTVAEAEPELKEQGFIALLDKVVETGEPFVGTEVPVTYHNSEGEGSPRTEYVDFIYQPLRHADGTIYAISVQGYNVTEKVLSRHAVENERENFRNLFRETPEMVCMLKGPEHVFEFVNAAHVRTLGFDATGMKVRDAQPESVEVHGILDKVYETGKTAELREIPVTVTNRLRYFNLTYSARRNLQGGVCGVMILGSEVTDQVLSRTSLLSHNAALERILSGAPLEEALAVSAKAIEAALGHEVRASVLLLDPAGERLLHGAAPSLPNEYNSKIHGLKIGPGVGSCGTAAFRGEEVQATDIQSDPLWQDFRELALAYGLNSCWSMPVRSSTGKVIGTYALYNWPKRKPSPEEKEVILLHTRTAALVIERETEARAKLEALEALKNSEAKFRTVSEAIPQMVWATATDGSITYSNRRWQEFTGYTLEESREQRMVEELHPDDLENVIGTMMKCRQTGDPFAMEYRLKSKEGIYRWFLGQALPLRDSSGQILQWFGTVTDIDERRRSAEMSELLAQASSVFAETLDYEKTLQSLASLTVSGLADWCSIALVEPGTSPRVAGAAHKDPEHLKAVQALFADYPTDWNAAAGAPQVIRSGVSELYELIPDTALQAAAKDERHLELMRSLGMKTAMIVPLAARGRTLGALTLISTDPGRRYSSTDLKFAEELGRRAGNAVDNGMLYADAQRAIQARDTFLSIASHELKTPLTALKLQIQIRARDLNKGQLKRFAPERLPELVADDEKQVNRLSRLIDDMLDVSRVHTGRVSYTPERFDLNELVSEVLARFAANIEAAETHVDFKQNGTALGTWDKFRIEQVFINLLTNALKYGAGSTIVVRIWTSNGRGYLSVRDNGIGISNVDHDRIFGQFERAVSASSISGLGLGLYISKKIIEAHRGNIAVRSEPNQGAEFTIELPLEQDEQILNEVGLVDSPVVKE